MSNTKRTPDVVVVGMPSCGKTVFFTVLGKKFTNFVDGKRGAPLGFRLSTCDRSTSSVVNVAYDRLKIGQWPEPTLAGQIMPLRWEVFTGRRRIFELFSMDIAGETFKKTFGIKDDDAGYGGNSKTTVPVVRTRKRTDSGDELYRSEASSGDMSEGGDRIETDEEKAALKLKAAVDSAKVVCFMVNIALPDGRSGRNLSNEDEKKLLRFRSSVLNMYLSLKENPTLRAKSMIVLTQAHSHQGEIERAGGPVMYLGDVCGGEASELCNLAKEHDIPVIAVSAVNESGRDSKELPRIESPDDIPSSGLFGFLLAVSGMVAHGDNLVGVKDAYLAYQRERAEYLKCPSQMVKIRLAQAKKCCKASAAFVKACADYLNDSANLKANGEAASAFPPAAVAMYKQFTREDPDVKTASRDEYIVRDRLWDRELRQVVVTGVQATAKDLYDAVRKGLENKFPDKVGNEENEEFVYGFGEDDLFAGSEAATFNGWVKLNLDEYRKDLDEDIKDLHELKKTTIKAIEALSVRVGGTEFELCLALAEKTYGELEEKLTAFRSAWLDSGRLSLSEVSEIEASAVGEYKKVSEYKSKHRLHEIKLRIAEGETKLQSLAVDVEKLFAFAGTSAFKNALESVEGRLTAFSEEFQEVVEERGQDCGSDSFGGEGIVTTYAAIRGKLQEAVKTDAIKCRKKIVAVNRVKGMVSMLLVMIMGASGWIGVRWYHDEKNRMTIQAIDCAVSQAEYAEAARLYGSLLSIEWLCVKRSDYLPTDFPERLRLAAKNHELDKSVEVYRKRHESLLEWLDGVGIPTEETKRARTFGREVEELCKTLPVAVSFAEMIQPDLNLDSRISLVQACEGQLKRSVDQLVEIKNGWSERLRKEDFRRSKENAEKYVREIDVRFCDLDLASVSNGIENVVHHIGVLQKLAGSDNADANAAKEYRREAEAVLEKLKARHAELRSMTFKRIIADILSAIAKRTVSKVWGKYDTARAFSSSVEERAELAKIHEEILGFAVKEHERTLADVEMTATRLKGESAISVEMLDAMRTSLETIEKVKYELRSRIPETHNGFAHINDLARKAQALMPVVVQIDGVRAGDNQPVDIRNAGRAAATILDGVSVETRVRCVYLLVLLDEFPSGSIRLVRVADETGKTHGVQIQLSNLVPGINRIEKTIE